MKKTVTILGCGTGNGKDLTAEAYEALARADLIIGAKRLLEASFITDIRMRSGGKNTAPAKCIPLHAAEEIAAAVRDAGDESIVIPVSGDSGFYSGAASYAAAIEKGSSETAVPKIRILPGISSLSYLSARTGIAWQDAEVYSLHGRRQSIGGALRRGAKILLLGGEGFEEVLRSMNDAGFSGRKIIAGMRLGSREEKILHGTPASLKGKVSEALSVLLIAGSEERMRCSGIDDEEFIRADVPMTKSEVRAVVLSRLAAGRGDVVYDIGAGTGSVSVEASFAAPCGSVYAIERNDTACRLIEKNREKFLAGNIEIVKGDAPDAFSDLPAPDCVFIGGSGGNLHEPFTSLAAKNPRVHVVLTAVTIETLQSATRAVEECGFGCTEITQIAATRYNRRGIYHMPESQSPVWVIAARPESEQKLNRVLRRRELKTKLKETVKNA